LSRRLNELKIVNSSKDIMDSTLNVNPYQLLSQFDDSMNNSELIEFVEQNIKLKPKDRPSIDY